MKLQLPRLQFQLPEQQVQENLQDLNEMDFERVSSILNLSTAIISGNIEMLKK